MTEYNPFKMWGSWIGAVYGLIANLIGYVGFLVSGRPSLVWGRGIIQKIIVLPAYVIQKFYNFIDKLIYPTNECVGGICQIANKSFFNANSNNLFIMLSTIILGFLIGWGIHSLFRRLT